MRRAWLLLGVVGVVVGALIVGAFVWSRATTFSAVGGPSVLSLAEVYRRAERELRQHDGVYVAELEASVECSGCEIGRPASATITRWVDVHRDVGREQRDMKPQGSYAMILTQD